MKKYAIILSLTIFVSVGCDKNNFHIHPRASVDSLSLYWHHEVFGENKRRLEFEFYEKKGYQNSYELIFDYDINGQNITIYLKDKIDKGECPKFPKPGNTDDLCIPKGGFFIPESELSEDNYSVTLKTLNFEIVFQLKLDAEQFILDIPKNDKLTTSIKVVYPISKDIMYGSVIFSGKENTEKAKALFNDFENNGFSKITVPNFNYRYLRVDNKGEPINKHWEPDMHSLGMIYKMETNFRKAFDLAKKHFDKSNFDIYLYSSNGDQASLSRAEGIIVEYAK